MKLNKIILKLCSVKCLTRKYELRYSWCQTDKKSFNLQFILRGKRDFPSLRCFFRNLLITFLQQREAQALTVRTDKIPEMMEEIKYLYLERWEMRQITHEKGENRREQETPPFSFPTEILLICLKFWYSIKTGVSLQRVSNFPPFKIS